MNTALSKEQWEAAARVNLWLVDDDEAFRQGFAVLLERQFGFQHIEHFGTAEEAIDALERDGCPDVVLLDSVLPGMSGVAAIGPMKARSPATRVFIYATYYDVSVAKQALASGGADYFTKHQMYEDVVAAVCGARPK